MGSRGKDKLREILDSLPDLTLEQKVQLDDLGDFITAENPGYFFTERKETSDNSALTIRTRKRRDG
jgi:hypothetical protein